MGMGCTNLHVMQPVLTFRWNARLSLESLLPFPRVKSSLPPIGVSTVLSRLRPSCWQLHDGVHARDPVDEHVMVSLLSRISRRKESFFQPLVCTLRPGTRWLLSCRSKDMYGMGGRDNVGLPRPNGLPAGLRPAALGGKGNN